MTFHTSVRKDFDLPFVPLIAAKVIEPDPVLLALLSKPTSLTATEWAYLAMVEATVGEEEQQQEVSNANVRDAC